MKQVRFASRWIEGHTLIPEWPSLSGAQRVVCAYLADAALQEQSSELSRMRQHLQLAVDHICALNSALDDLASLGATIAICGTTYDDAAARKVLET